MGFFRHPDSHSVIFLSMTLDHSLSRHGHWHWLTMSNILSKSEPEFLICLQACFPIYNAPLIPPRNTRKRRPDTHTTLLLLSISFLALSFKHYCQCALIRGEWGHIYHPCWTEQSKYLALVLVWFEPSYKAKIPIPPSAPPDSTHSSCYTLMILLTKRSSLA